MFVLDLLLAVLASFIAILLVRYTFSAIPEFSNYFFKYIIGAAVASGIALLVSKTYRILFKYALFKSVLNILTCAVLKSVLLIIPFFLYRDIILPHYGLLIVFDFSATIIILIIGKVLIFLYPTGGDPFKDEQEENAISKLNVVIYGTDTKSIAVVTRYENSQRYNVNGFVTRDKSLNGKIIMGLPVYYLPKNLNEFAFKDVEAVLFSRYEDMQADKSFVKECNKRGICILAIPGTDNTSYPGLEVNEIKHMLENTFIPDHMSGIGRATKRIIDFSISAILIVVFSPLMLIIAIAVLVNDGKPVIYQQERIGRFGRPFNILKFRTMRLDAEAAGPALYGGDDDPRLTKVGKFLRAHHLDELPQLFNVFLGQMSFVGYRPERKVFIDKIVENDPRYAYLYQIRPGVTSYATLKNGYTDTMDKMLRRLKFDLYYLNHRSLFFDMKVLLDTFLNIAIGKKF